MDRLLTLKYYFATRPDPDFQFTKLTLAVIAFFFLLSLALKIYRKKYAKDVILKKMIKRYPSRLLAFGTALLLLLLFRETGIPFFSMRIWWVLWLLIFLYWVVRTLISFKKEYRRRFNQAKQKAIKTKYLPRKKR